MRIVTPVLLLAAALPAWAASSAKIDADHVSVALLGDADALVPGKTAQLGLRLRHDAHWHTYWINPGDSGLPTKLAWHLPDGFKAGEIAWPTPQRFTVGELYNFGYDGDVLLPVSVDVPATASIGSTVAVSVDAKWLVCQQQCIPGKATLTLQLPVKAAAAVDVAAATAFGRAHATQPRTETSAQARVQGDRIVVTLPVVATTTGLDAFAQTPNVVSNAPPQIAASGAGAVLTFAKSDYATSLPANFNLLIIRPGAPATQAHVAIANSQP